MKKIYRPLLKVTNWVLSGLVGLLGFSFTACEKNDMVEYGCPSATYTVKGKVTNTDGKPINGIEINVRTDFDRGGLTKTVPWQPCRSDQEGNYTMMVSTTGASDFMLYASDVDGENNGGLFQTDSILVRGSKITLVDGDKHWYQGHGEATANFTLKEEKTTEDE